MNTQMSREEFHRKQAEITKACSAKKRHAEWAINQLAQTYNYQPTPGQIKAFADMTIGKIETSCLYQAVDMHISTSQWFPKPYEIRELAQRIPALPTRAWLWDRLSKIMEKHLAGEDIDIEEFEILQADYIDEYGPHPTGGQWIELDWDQEQPQKDPFKPGQKWEDYAKE